MDIRKGPLERAQEHIREEGLEERIVVRLSDGLQELKPGEADCVVISGMGGSLTVRILEEGRPALESVRELILSPHSEVYRVREWIRDGSFSILDEDMVEEGGKYYVVIKAVRRAENPAEGAVRRGTDPKKRAAGRADDPAEGAVRRGTDPKERAAGRADDPAEGTACGESLPEDEKRAECECEYGPVLLRRRHPVLLEYLQREKKLCMNILRQMEESADTGKNLERRAQLKDRLETIAAAMACFESPEEQPEAGMAGMRH